MSWPSWPMLTKPARPVDGSAERHHQQRDGDANGFSPPARRSQAAVEQRGEHGLPRATSGGDDDGGDQKRHRDAAHVHADGHARLVQPGRRGGRRGCLRRGHIRGGSGRQSLLVSAAGASVTPSSLPAGILVGSWRSCLCSCLCPRGWSLDSSCGYQRRLRPAHEQAEFLKVDLTAGHLAHDPASEEHHHSV